MLSNPPMLLPGEVRCGHVEDDPVVFQMMLAKLVQEHWEVVIAPLSPVSVLGGLVEFFDGVVRNIRSRSLLSGSYSRR